MPVDLPDDYATADEIGVVLVEETAVALRPFQSPGRVMMVGIVDPVATTLGGTLVFPRVNQHTVINVEAAWKIRQVRDEKSLWRAQGAIHFAVGCRLLRAAVR